MKAALASGLAARAGLSSVLVSYGAPINAPREFIALGDVSGSQDFATLGAKRKDEIYTLDVYCSVLREGNQQQACTERCFELAAEIENFLRDDPTCSSTVRVAQLKSPFSLTEYGSDQARQSVLTIGIEATERI